MYPATARGIPQPRSGQTALTGRAVWAANGHRIDATTRVEAKVTDSPDLHMIKDSRIG
jgi:hypothetical protein